jgi:putative membrane protein
MNELSRHHLQPHPFMFLQASDDVEQIRRRRILPWPEHPMPRLHMKSGLLLQGREAKRRNDEVAKNLASQLPRNAATKPDFSFSDNPNPRFRNSYTGGLIEMKSVIATTCCLALCCLTVSGQKEHAAKPMTDQQFVDFIAQTDMLEAHLGQMAADQAARQDVKDYASMLVADHTADYQKLSAMAAQDGLTVPNALDAAHNRMIAPFDKLKGAAFDTRYVHEMIAGHTEAIATFTKEADNAEHADLKAAAGATLPTLQKHLDGAENLEKPPAKK